MIDWKNIEDKIKNCKYKHVIIFNFFNLMEFIDDTNAAIILRLIIKNNIEIFSNHPFYTLCQYIPKEIYPITLDLIISFYELIREKGKLIVLLSKWYYAYKNKIFWNKEIDKQIEDLEFLKKYILAIFDNSFGGVSFGLKMSGIFRTNVEYSRDITIDSAIERLSLVYDLMGKNFFTLAKIPVLSVSDFINLTDESKVKYVNTIHVKTVELISLTIDIFEKYSMINLKIENLLDPFYVNIEENTSMSDDIEDMKIFF